MNMLQNGIGWLESALMANASVIVTYHRGNDSVSVNAVEGTTRTEESFDGAVSVRSKVLDFIIDSTLIDFGNGPTAPRVADRIRKTVSGEVLEFAVVELAGGSVTSPLDGRSKLIRVHTKFTGVVEE
jgi:hypothetical protein